MASHADDPGDSVSAAKLTLYGSIGAALISAAPIIIVALMNHTDDTTDTTLSKGPTPTAITPTPTTITPTASQVSDRGSADQFVISETGDVTVSGSAQQDVNGMFVLIGPKPSGGYWVGYANVLNQHWQADVATDPPWQNYTISVHPYYGPSGGAASQSAFKFNFFQGTEPTTPPPPPPTDQIRNCAEQFGPNCFNGPGFGPPSVYQQNQ
jgi:hypothetical protein